MKSVVITGLLLYLPIVPPADPAAITTPREHARKILTQDKTVNGRKQ